MLSRVADSLYWCARYLERAEQTARLLEVNLMLMLDQSPEHASRRWHRLLASLCIDDKPDQVEFDPRKVAYMLTCDPENEASILTCISNARENLRQVRDSVSSEMFEQLNRLYHAARNTDFDTAWNSGLNEFLVTIKMGSHLFQGLTESTFSHEEGYHFITLGRNIERGLMRIALLEAYRSYYEEDSAAPDSHLDLVALLRCAAAFEAYCREYTASLKKRRIAEFLLLNPHFPHSVCFSVQQVKGALDWLKSQSPSWDTRPAERPAGLLAARLLYTTIDEVGDYGTKEYLEEVREVLEELHNHIREVFVAYPVEKVLAG